MRPTAQRKRRQPISNPDRGDICELCGTHAKPKPGAGKQRYRHKCSHGLWCARGTSLGISQNHATCDQCRAHGRYAS